MQAMLEMLGQQLGGDPIRQLAGRLGASTAATSAGVAAALPMLLHGVGQLSQSGAGAAAGLGALLDNHQGGGVLGDLAGFFGQGASGLGGGLLGQLLGDSHDAAHGAVARASGLSGAQVSQLLALLAPVVLSFLARMRQGGGVPAPGAGEADSGLGGLLGGLLGGSGGGAAAGGLGSVLGGESGGLGGLLGGLLGGGGGGGAASGAVAGGQPKTAGSDLDDLAAQGAKILGGLLGG